MTKDDIIRMAREAGSIDSKDVIETVFNAFAAAERQACAAMVEPVDESLADAIRARGEK